MHRSTLVSIFVVLGHSGIIHACHQTKIYISNGTLIDVGKFPFATAKWTFEAGSGKGSKEDGEREAEMRNKTLSNKDESPPPTSAKPPRTEKDKEPTPDRVREQTETESPTETEIPTEPRAETTPAKAPKTLAPKTTPANTPPPAQTSNGNTQTLRKWTTTKTKVTSPLPRAPDPVWPNPYQSCPCASPKLFDATNATTDVPRRTWIGLIKGRQRSSGKKRFCVATVINQLFVAAPANCICRFFSDPDSEDCRTNMDPNKKRQGYLRRHVKLTLVKDEEQNEGVAIDVMNTIDFQGIAILQLKAKIQLTDGSDFEAVCLPPNPNLAINTTTRHYHFTDYTSIPAKDNECRMGGGNLPWFKTTDECLVSGETRVNLNNASYDTWGYGVFASGLSTIPKCDSTSGPNATWPDYPHLPVYTNSYSSEKSFNQMCTTQCKADDKFFAFQYQDDKCSKPKPKKFVDASTETVTMFSYNFKWKQDSTSSFDSDYFYDKCYKKLENKVVFDPFLGVTDFSKTCQTSSSQTTWGFCGPCEDVEKLKWFDLPGQTIKPTGKSYIAGLIRHRKREDQSTIICPVDPMGAKLCFWPVEKQQVSFVLDETTVDQASSTSTAYYNFAPNRLHPFCDGNERRVEDESKTERGKWSWVDFDNPGAILWRGIRQLNHEGVRWGWRPVWLGIMGYEKNVFEFCKKAGGGNFHTLYTAAPQAARVYNEQMVNWVLENTAEGACW